MLDMKGVIFDLDGVLIDSEGLHHESYAQVLRRFGVEVSVMEYGREWIHAGRGPEYAVERYRLPLEPNELRREKAVVYHDLLRREVALMPGARSVLERSRGRFRLALATNSNADDTGFVLERFALRAFFDAVVTRGDYERAKPAPDAYLAAAARIGCAGHRCVAVEDSQRGIQAATAAGCRTIAVPHRYTTADDFGAASRVVRGLDDVTVALLEELLASDAEGS
jgi:HAD superfamily hydrolase (TIGR01509 family)